MRNPLVFNLFVVKTYDSTNRKPKHLIHISTFKSLWEVKVKTLRSLKKAVLNLEMSYKNVTHYTFLFKDASVDNIMYGDLV